MESAPIPFRELNAPPNTPPLLLFFEEKAVKDERASRDGPPIFDKVVYVRVIVAGSKDGPSYEVRRIKADGSEKIDREAYKRFGKPYEEWIKGQAPSSVGTPLEQWPLMDVAMVATFKASNVYTVQDLAGLSDSMLDQSIRRGGREWRAKAQSWLAEATTAAGDAELRATNARQQEEIDGLKAQVKELLKRQNNIGYDKPKRTNREKPDAEMHVAVQEESELRL